MGFMSGLKLCQTTACPAEMANLLVLIYHVRPGAHLTALEPNTADLLISYTNGANFLSLHVTAEVCKLFLHATLMISLLKHQKC